MNLIGKLKIYFHQIFYRPVCYLMSRNMLKYYITQLATTFIYVTLGIALRGETHCEIGCRIAI